MNTGIGSPSKTVLRVSRYRYKVVFDFGTDQNEFIIEDFDEFREVLMKRGYVETPEGFALLDIKVKVSRV